MKRRKDKSIFKKMQVLMEGQGELCFRCWFSPSDFFLYLSLVFSQFQDLLCYLFYYYYYCCYYYYYSYTCPHFPLLSSALNTSTSYIQFSPCCLCPWVLYTCYLMTLPLLLPIIPLSPPFWSLSVCISMSLVLFCSLVCFID